MARKFDYTTQARAFALQHPLLTHILIQVNFWIIGYVLLITIMHFSYKSVAVNYDVDMPMEYLAGFWSAILIGILYGSTLGFLDYKIDHGHSRRIPLGIMILLRSVIYVTVLFALLGFLRYILWDKILIVYFLDPEQVRTTDQGWFYTSIIIALYSAILAPGISFINQMNRKFGPGVLIPMLLGKYRNPIEQERLFIFLDLKSSTTIAEKLGHVRYSSLIQDCFLDINDVLFDYKAEIYQYVGDEIVISWLKVGDFDEKRVLDFYFAQKDKFAEQSDHYQQEYGVLPQFKAGAHLGLVTAVEVGDIKREIAYHGDTLNTGARIQGMCNQYQSSLLISEAVASDLGDNDDYNVNYVGEITLRGKERSTRIYDVKRENKH